VITAPIATPCLLLVASLVLARLHTGQVVSEEGRLHARQRCQAGVVARQLALLGDAVQTLALQGQLRLSGIAAED
jgi:hypothetical protein